MEPNSTACLMCFLRNISTMHTPIGELIKNHNRVIRRWLPKGTKKTTPKEVAFIENWINNYPKKCLDYKSPREDCLLANLKFSFKLIIDFYS